MQWPTLADRPIFFVLSNNRWTGQLYLGRLRAWLWYHDDANDLLELYNHQWN
jgi:hypothetical protein